MKTPMPVLWSQMKRVLDEYEAFRFFTKSDLAILRGILPASSEARETRQIREAVALLARLLWAEKIIEPRTSGEAFASHLTTMTAAVAHIALEDRTTDTDTRRRRLACWLWCATLARHPTLLKDPVRLDEDVRALADWLRGSTSLPRPVEAAQDLAPTAEDLLGARSRTGRIFRCVEVQLYQRGVRDLQTGEPIEVGLHFGERPHVDHIFAKAWCADQTSPPNPLEVDSIVNKTVLAPFTNMSKSAVPPSRLLLTLETRGVSHARLTRLLEDHLISIATLERDDFDGFKTERAARLRTVLQKAIEPPT